MDCEFFEESYYFPQLSSQGENRVENLNWLTYPGRIDPKEQVGNTTDTGSESIVPSSDFQSTSVPEHLDSPKVIDDTPRNKITDDVTLESINDEPNVEQSIELSNRYILPPRSTRGIPPRRYDLEYESKRSRYPVDQSNNESLADIALAFNTSLYSNKLPRNVEEALQDPKWKRVMEQEILALMKNETWEKCELSKGKKTV